MFFFPDLFPSIDPYWGIADVAHVANNAFGLPISMNTLIILLFLGAMIVGFIAWMLVKNAEGFFE